MTSTHAATSRLRRFDVWLLSPAPAERLAALRILVGGFVLVYMIVNVGEFHRLAQIPSAPFEPVGIARCLDQPVSGTAVWILFVLLLSSGAAFVAGLWFRVTGPTFAVLTLAWASYHSSWGQTLHFEHLFTLHLLVLGLTPAAAVWSCAPRQLRRKRVDASVQFGWPIRIMAIITVLTYVIAGISKLRQSGLAWVDGSTLGNHIAYSAIRIEQLGGFEPPLAALVIGRPWLIAPMAVAALALELFAPMALVGGRVRNIWVIAAMVFHASTAMTMMVFFPYQGLGFALLPFFRVERAQRAVASRFEERSVTRRRGPFITKLSNHPDSSHQSNS